MTCKEADCCKGSGTEHAQFLHGHVPFTEPNGLAVVEEVGQPGARYPDRGSSSFSAVPKERAGIEG